MSDGSLIKSMPASVQSLFWSGHFGVSELNKNKPLLIHRVLALGNLDDIRWLFGVFSKKAIGAIFRQYPMNIYTKSAFFFAARPLLHLKKLPPISNYVKTVY